MEAFDINLPEDDEGSAAAESELESSPDQSSNENINPLDNSNQVVEDFEDLSSLESSPDPYNDPRGSKRRYESYINQINSFDSILCDNIDSYRKLYSSTSPNEPPPVTDRISSTQEHRLADAVNSNSNAVNNEVVNSNSNSEAVSNLPITQEPIIANNSNTNSSIINTSIVNSNRQNNNNMINNSTVAGNDASALSRKICNTLYEENEICYKCGKSWDINGLFIHTTMNKFICLMCSVTYESDIGKLKDWEGRVYRKCKKCYRCNCKKSMKRFKIGGKLCSYCSLKKKWLFQLKKFARS